MANVAFTWLGHGGYRFDSAEGKRIYVDPWLENPKFPESERDLERVDVLVLTHGHNDHIANAVDICKQHSPKVVAIFELAGWLESQGAEGASALGMNKGGTVDVDGIKFTMTHALHSSGFGGGDRITYLGEAAGFVIEFENGLKVYCAGDTAVFGDMQLIGRLHSPDVAVLPIGDHFTMGPRAGRARARAARHEALHPRALGDVRAADGHAGRAPRAGVRGRGARRRAGADDRAVMRERWWGASGRRVPEIALEGELPLEEALVLDEVDDLERLHEAHDAGQPVVVRADSEEAVVRALARPEVAAVVVPDAKRELLELDLTKLTYG